VTTTPLQALALLNNKFILNKADAMANRLKSQSDGNGDKQIEQAFLSAFQRNPDSEEMLLAKRLIEDYGLTALCRSLFNSNEFVIIN
jgi:hypothetical protein